MNNNICITLGELNRIAKKETENFFGDFASISVSYNNWNNCIMTLKFGSFDDIYISYTDTYVKIYEYRYKKDDINLLTYHDDVCEVVGAAEHGCVSNLIDRWVEAICNDINYVMHHQQ